MGVPHPETLGQWLKPGKPFCEVGDPHHLEAHLILDQGDIDLIRLEPPRLGQDLRRLRDTYHERGRRDRQAEPRRDPPRALERRRRRDRRPRHDPKTGQIKPLRRPSTRSIIPIDNPKLTLQPGLRGFAKIDGGTHTLGWWLWRLLNKTFNFTI